MTQRIRSLLDAAAALCAAQDELQAAGYGIWADDLRDLIEIVGAEIGWLEQEAALTLSRSATSF